MSDINILDICTPTGRQILVKVYDLCEKTAGGVYISEISKDSEIHHTTCGQVIAMGPYAYEDEKFFKGPFCKVGDWVLFGRYAPKVKNPNYKIALLNDTDVLGITAAPNKYFGFSR